MRSIVFLSAVRRERERGGFASTDTAVQPKRKHQQQQQGSPETTDANAVVSPTAAAGAWQWLTGFCPLAGEQPKPTPAVAIVAAAAAAAAAAAPTAGNETKPNPAHHDVSLAPLMAVLRLMRRVRADSVGGAATNRQSQREKTTHPGVFSSKDARHLLTATVASLEESDGRRGDRSDSSTMPSVDWKKFIYGEGDDDSVVEEHGRHDQDWQHACVFSVQYCHYFL